MIVRKPSDEDITDWTYEAAIDHLYRIARRGSALGLERIALLLDQAGNPHHFFKCIHVAGTNGKGSTTAFIASILESAGFKTGRYTSPHLEVFEERISINGEPMSRDELVAQVSRLSRLTGDSAAEDQQATFFEFVTALAFEHFRSRGVDMAVLEVGLGGRLDATNVIEPPLVAVITSIGLDHMEYLGDTLPAIAAEKAGILKTGSVAVTATRDPAALEVIRRTAAERRVDLWTVASAGTRGAADVCWRKRASSLEVQTFDLSLPDGEYADLEIALAGDHQLDNAACAVAAIHRLRTTGRPVPESAIRGGLAQARWPGRFEVLRRRPWVILDGAHNPQGAAVLCRTLETALPGARPVMVLGAMGDKDLDGLVEPLAAMARMVVATRPSYPGRAADPAAIAAAARRAGGEVQVVEPAEAALRRGLDLLAGEDDVLVVAGSLYLVGEARFRLRAWMTGDAGSWREPPAEYGGRRA
ncbi:MAG TPA: bifunctional folylpolyglutamate synthase/dihydrofolate synthase [Clostridiales bacterium]|nr:bifunctional folylpolyglutamate synthase/dihydrofolate synthase [Clostridiales bacterium]